jgi:hypothetical protein
MINYSLEGKEGSLAQSFSFSEDDGQTLVCLMDNQELH